MSSYLHDKEKSRTSAENQNPNQNQEIPLHLTKQNNTSSQNQSQKRGSQKIKNVNSPVLRLLANELAHQLLALLALHVDDFDAARLEVRFAAEESVVLAEHDARDLVEDAGAGAHVAGRERGVHGGAFVGGGGQAACVFEGGDFGLCFEREC